MACTQFGVGPGAATMPLMTGSTSATAACASNLRHGQLLACGCCLIRLMQSHAAGTNILALKLSVHVLCCSVCELLLPRCQTCSCCRCWYAVNVLTPYVAACHCVTPAVSSQRSTRARSSAALSAPACSLRTRSHALSQAEQVRTRCPASTRLVQCQAGLLLRLPILLSMPCALFVNHFQTGCHVS